jgi:hypothetical protein
MDKHMITRTPEEVRNLLTAALRSGAFNQGRMVMKAEHVGTTPSYCCLGVLYHLAWLDGGKRWGEKDGARGNDALPPQCFKEFMKGHIPDFSTLVRWNDSGVSFDEIADRIEKFAKDKK